MATSSLSGPRSLTSSLPSLSSLSFLLQALCGFGKKRWRVALKTSVAVEGFLSTLFVHWASQWQLSHALPLYLHSQLRRQVGFLLHWQHRSTRLSTFFLEAPGAPPQDPVEGVPGVFGSPSLGLIWPNPTPWPSAVPRGTSLPFPSPRFCAPRVLFFLPVDVLVMILSG